MFEKMIYELGESLLKVVEITVWQTWYFRDAVKNTPTPCMGHRDLILSLGRRPWAGNLHLQTLHYL